MKEDLNNVLSKQEQAIRTLESFSMRLDAVQMQIVSLTAGIKDTMAKLLEANGLHKTDPRVKALLYENNLDAHCRRLAADEFIKWMRNNFTVTGDQRDAIPTALIYNAYRATKEAGVSRDIMSDGFNRGGYVTKTVGVTEYDDNLNERRTSFRAVVFLKANDMLLIDSLAKRWQNTRENHPGNKYYLEQFKEAAKVEILARHQLALEQEGQAG